MTERPVDYFSYLLRMWRTGKESAWRVSLEDPQTGERLGFNGLNTLFSFLQQKTQASSNQVDEIDSLGGEGE